MGMTKDERSALIVEPEDSDALATAVVRVLSDRLLAGELVAGARELVAEHLGPERSLAGFRLAIELARSGGR